MHYLKVTVEFFKYRLLLNNTQRKKKKKRNKTKKNDTTGNLEGKKEDIEKTLRTCNLLYL